MWAGMLQIYIFCLFPVFIKKAGSITEVSKNKTKKIQDKKTLAEISNNQAGFNSPKLAF